VIKVDLGEIEVLIDGGGKSPGVVKYLRDHVDGPLEVMVATHPHADHIGGLIAVLDAFQVQQIWHNGDTSESKTYAEYMTAVNAEGAEIHIARLHNTIKTGGLKLFVHHPANLEGSINNNSVVLHLAYGSIDFLFTGDAEKEAEWQMMMLSSVRLPEVEILKVGHHGSRTASSTDFLSITSPEIAIYMAGKDNRYGHPHQETIDALTQIGARIYGIDVNGTITVTTDGETYSVSTHC
jgi:competence protein ComEC